MRKVLLRFVFDQVWQWQSVENELRVGAGWLIVASLILVTSGFAVLWAATRNARESAMSAGFWLIVPTFFGVLTVFRPGLAFVESGIPVFGYGLMMFVGFSTATWTASRLVRHIGQPPEAIWDMMMWALIPGLLGARLVYLVFNWQDVIRGKTGAQFLLALISLWDGGIVFYGSVIGGILGVVVYCRRRGIDPVRMFDVLGPCMLLGEGFGRIGCFLYGCCYGRACDRPWAVQFPSDSLVFEKLSSNGTLPPGALQTIPLHPTQLYSSMMGFVLAAIVGWFFLQRPFRGAVMSLAWILYPISRFVLETFRDDEPKRLGTPLTTAQLVSIGLLISGAMAMYWFWKQQTGRQQVSTLRAA